MLQNHRIGHFNQTVWDYYLTRGRHDLPWRQAEPNGLFDPYYILVSEIMLQQTQVNRVVPKFTAFISRFPDIQSLAAAPLAPILQAWSGLGYNRRAKFLWQAARQVAAEYGGVMPPSAISLYTCLALALALPAPLGCMLTTHPKCSSKPISALYLSTIFLKDNRR